MSQVTVSVIVPTLNSDRTIESCLTAIKKNGSKYEYEIIIVDAGSTDKTLEIARPYVDKILEGEPGRINRNIGIEIAQGEIICCVKITICSCGKVDEYKIRSVHIIPTALDNGTTYEGARSLFTKVDRAFAEDFAERISSPEKTATH